MNYSNAQQIIYLDFNGENTIYNNKDLNITFNVDVEDSRMSEEQKFYILSQLEKMYDDSDVQFTLSRPDDEEYSTIYIGNTDAFAPYGTFFGVAETIDKDNQIKNDNAFVLADYRSDSDSVISVIAHEVGHIVKGMEHENASGSLADYGDIAPNVKMGTLNPGGTLSVTSTIMTMGYYYFTCAANCNVTISISPMPTYRLGGYEHNGFRLMDTSNTSGTQTIRGASYSFTGIAGHEYQISIGILLFTKKFTITVSNNSGGDIPDDPDEPVVTQKSDLVISACTLSSTSITSDQSLTLSFTVQNNGNSSAGASYVYVYDGSTFVDSVYVGSIAAGSYKILSYTFDAGDLTAGSHSLKVKADGANSIQESNEENNYSSTKYVTVSEPIVYYPDLTISSYSVSSTNITSAQSLTLSFTVRNNGSSSTGASYVYIYDGSTYVDRVYVSNIAADSYKNLSYTFDAGDLMNNRTFAFRVKADGANSIQESDEDNNYSDTIYVTTSEPIVYSPDLVISFCSVSSTNITSNQSLTLSFTIQNNGNSSAEASYVYIYDGSTFVDSVYVSSIAAGSYKNLSYTFDAGNLTAGSHSLRVKADGTNSIQESDDENNYSSTKYVTVSEPVVYSPDLIISSFSVSSTNITSDQTLTLNFTVQNNSNSSAEASYVYIYDGSTFVDSVYVSSMAAGAYRNLSYTFDAGNLTAGSHSLRVKADGTNSIQESNEENNYSSTKYVTVSAAEVLTDLRPDILAGWSDSVVISKSANKYTDEEKIYENDKLFVHWGVYNPKNTVFDVAVYLDEELYCTTAMDSNKDFISINGLSSGKHTIKVVIDPDNQIKESNENNNVFTKEFTIEKTSAAEELPASYKNGEFKNIYFSPSSTLLTISQDNFITSAKIPVFTSGVDIAGSPAGYSIWQSLDNTGVITNYGILSGNDSGAEVFDSTENGQLDVFFVQTNGKWDSTHAAMHQGATGSSWKGTGEIVALTGKNKIEDLFFGSDDFNVMLLTDDANGDALFLDDIYTNNVTQARLKQLDCIWAGAGDDIIDLTSSRYDYTGYCMEICGGDGNDIIWGNKGSNMLFGDAGNDRIIGGSGDDTIVGGSGNDSMHGGGGNDIFTFGSNWGNDTVEQIAGGEVTLWFEYGSYTNWNRNTMTYSDGTNSVKVTGVTAEHVQLAFGEDPSMFPDGVFANTVSSRIFSNGAYGSLA